MPKVWLFEGYGNAQYNTRSIGKIMDEAKKKAIYTYDDKVYNDPADLSKALTSARKIGETKVTKGPNPTFRCVIRGDREAQARSLSVAMNAAALAGISDISFSTVNRD